MKNKELKIEIPDGYEIDRENSTFEKIVFKKIESKLPKSWEELKIISGYYLDSWGDICECEVKLDTISDNRNIFPTKEEAEAALALSQLLQWRNKYYNGWKSDFISSNVKYAIKPYKDKIDIMHVYSIHYILTFETYEKADKFLKDHRKLIEQAKPLL